MLSGVHNSDNRTTKKSIKIYGAKESHRKKKRNKATEKNCFQCINFDYCSFKRLKFDIPNLVLVQY